MDTRLKFLSLLLALAPAFVQAQTAEQLICPVRKALPEAEYNQVKERYDATRNADPLQRAQAAADLAIAFYSNHGWQNSGVAAEAIKLWSSQPGASTAAAMNQTARRAALAGDCSTAASINGPALSMLGDFAPASNELGLTVLTDQARYLFASNRLSELHSVQNKLVAYWEGQGLPMTAFQAPFYASVAAAKLRKNALVEAESMARRVAEAGRASGDKAVTSSGLQTLAAVLYLQSRYQEGEQLRAEYLKLVPPQRGNDVLDALDEQMRSMYRNGQAGLAIERGHAVLVQLEAELTMATGGLRSAQSKLQEGNATGRLRIEQEIRRHERQVAAAHRKVASLKLGLADLQHASQRYAEAEASYLAAKLYFDDRKYAVTAGELLMSAQLDSALAEMYRKQSRFAEARRLQQKAYDAFLEMLGAAHPNSQHSQEELAKIDVSNPH